MAPPTVHHVIFCSCPLALSLLLFSFISSYLRPAVTGQCTKRVIVYVAISYSLYIRYIFIFLSSLYTPQ